MGFLSYNIAYYRDELDRMERTTATDADLYRAKQLLKILDDLLDEGYTELNNVLEKEIRGVSRLRAYLAANHAEPFPMSAAPVSRLTYGMDEYELCDAVDGLMCAAQSAMTGDHDAFLNRLVLFSEWIGYEPDTAYIFLLRDTLLPYVYFKSRGRENLYPWLLGRKAMQDITGCKNSDDEMRGAIIDALEEHAGIDFESFCDAILPRIRSFLSRRPEVVNTVGEALNSIAAKRIVVVESGCSGTFPMLLKALDSRVDIRMYTTYPYLLEAYGERVFTSAYEENRLFETMYSQDMLFRFAAMRDGRYYVNRCTDSEVLEKALCEVKTML